jgi:S-(hydroxymethyl)glutathione dehydrogenase/alcohol dehydrogenase|eukprot:SAG25_NODE_138_length_14172_cov_11.875364_2_plen_147_part_00
MSYVWLSTAQPATGITYLTPIFRSRAALRWPRYTVLHEESAAKIRDDAPLEKAPLLACALPTGYGAVFNTAKVEADSIIAVFGVGTVGLAIVEACKRAGAKRIIAIDTNPEKFDRAVTFGATDCVNPKDIDGPIQDAIIAMTNGGA